MLRSILAVVVGYLAMAVLAMLSFTPAFLTPDLVFETDGVGVSVGFLVFSLALGGVAAVVGGFVAALVAGKRAWLSLRALVAIVLVIGVGSAVYGLFQAPPTRSNEELARMTPMERAALSHEPVWYAFLLPFIGSAGVFAGGWLARQRGHSVPVPRENARST